MKISLEYNDILFSIGTSVLVQCKTKMTIFAYPVVL